MRSDGKEHADKGQRGADANHKTTLHILSVPAWITIIVHGEIFGNGQTLRKLGPLARPRFA
jgi:hypothetical protein